MKIILLQIRGIPAHHWTTCLHVESLRATFNMDYYFSVKTYDLEGSQKEIPLRASINGIGRLHVCEHQT